ncbi:hypothetical protein C0995_006776 [Termitomyces sp. Mi166|nr:hypothetical protein C0995_006776 [Termitomyces sp. Mi166\
MGLFFIFPDVSIRWRGRFQLGVTVTKISRTDLFGGVGVSDHGVVLAETRTRSFDVLTYAQYTAMSTVKTPQRLMGSAWEMKTYLASYSSFRAIMSANDYYGDKQNYAPPQGPPPGQGYYPPQGEPTFMLPNRS